MTESDLAETNGHAEGVDAESLAEEAGSSGDEPRGESVYDRVTGALGPVADAVGRHSAILVVGVVGLFGRLAHEFAKTGSTMLLTLMPFGESIWRKLAYFATYQYHKRAGGDAVALTHMPSGSVRMEAVKYKDADIEDQQPAGWHSKDRDRSWDEGADGREIDYLGGKTPVALFDESATQRATPLEARYAQALDLDEVEDIYLNARLQQTTVEAPAGGAQAIADGGVSSGLTVDAKGALADSVVDIGPRDGHDGMRISVRKVKETYREKTDSEKMEEISRLSFLAGRMGNMDRSDVVKIMLIALGIVAAATMGPGLVEGIFSSASAATSGSGGGGVIPF
jgi:hypothetical protein